MHDLTTRLRILVLTGLGFRLCILSLVGLGFRLRILSMAEEISNNITVIKWFVNVLVILFGFLR